MQQPPSEFAEGQNSELVKLLLEYFVTTTSIVEEADFLKEHPQLLDKKVIDLLDWMVSLDYKGLPQDDGVNLRRIIKLRRQFLELCIEKGVEAAFNEVHEQEKLFRIFNEFHTASTWVESKHVIEEHLKLLDPRVDQMIQGLIESAVELGQQVDKQHFEQSRKLLNLCRQFGTEATYAVFEEDDLGPATFELFSASSDEDLKEAIFKLNSDEGENKVKQAIISAREQISEENLLPMEEKYRQLRLLRSHFLFTQSLMSTQNIEDIDEILHWIELHPELFSDEAIEMMQNAIEMNEGNEMEKGLLEWILKIMQIPRKPESIIENNARQYFQILENIAPWPPSPDKAQAFAQFVWIENLETAIQVLQQHQELLTFESDVYISFSEKLEQLEAAWTVFTDFYSQRILDRIGLLLDSRLRGLEAAFKIWSDVETNRQGLVLNLSSFIEAKSLWQSKRILEKHPELLSQDALTLLSSFAGGARNYGVELDVQKCVEHYDLLKRCLNSDVETAFAEHPQRMVEHYRDARLTASSAKQRAAMQHRLGRAYDALGDREAAIIVYRDALEFYNPIDFPAECYEIASDLNTHLIDKGLGEEAAISLTLTLIATELRAKRQPTSEDFSQIAEREEHWFHTCVHWAGDSPQLVSHCVELTRGTGADYTFASLSHKLGTLYGKSGQPEQAILPFEEALAFFKSYPDISRRITCFVNLGIAKYKTMQLEEAERLFTEALGLAIQNSENERKLDILCHLGDVYIELKDYQRAETCILEAKQGYQALNLFYGEATCASRLGDICFRQSRFQEADQWNDLALKLTQLGNADWDDTLFDSDTKKYVSSYRESTRIPIEVMLVSSGNAEFKSGRFQEALEHYQAALRLTRSIRNWEFEALVLGNLGNLYSRLGQHELAIETYNEALELNRKIDDRSGEARCLGNLGLVHFILRDSLKAIGYYEAAQNIYEELGDIDITNMAMLANAYHATGEVETAFQYQNKALELARNTKNIDAEAGCLVNLAVYHRNNNEMDEVERLYAQALSLNQQSGDLVGQFVCLTELAEIHARRGDFKQSFSNYCEALKLGDVMRAPLAATAHRSGISSGRFDILKDAVETGLRSKSYEEVLELLELGKTRWLSDQMVRRNLLPTDHPLYGEYIRCSDMLDATAAASFTKTAGWLTLPQPEFPGETPPLSSFEQALADFNSIVERISESQPELRIIHGVSLDDVKFEKMRRALPDKKTAFVEFAIGDKQTTAFVVFSNQTSPQVINIPNLTQDYLEFLVGGRYGTPAAYGVPTVGYWISGYLNRGRDRQAWFDTISSVIDELGEALWPELDSLLRSNGIERVILIPQGPLFMLPLHAASIGGNGGEAVIERYTVAYAPSALIYQKLRGRKSQLLQDNINPLIVGNPTNDLDFSTIEALTIVKMLNVPASMFLQKKQATKSDFLTLANKAGIIHFAGHGVYEWGNSYNSGLLLAGSREPDRLTLSEIRYHLRLLQTYLVVFSACETNIIESGQAQIDEYLGLPAAILLAGAPAVIGSLWAVQDLSTALLMERLYRELLTSADDAVLISPAEALRRAQLWLRGASQNEILPIVQNYARQLASIGALTEAMNVREQMGSIKKMNNFPFAHPYYWGAFQAVGDVI